MSIRPEPSPHTESALALAANIAGYDARDDREFAAGSPHLRFQSLRSLHESLVDRAYRSLPASSEGNVHVLEIGAGNGEASVPWFMRRVAFTAVDSSRVALERLKQRAAAFGVVPDVFVGDAVAFAANADRRFDVVTGVSLLHHIPDYLALISASVDLVVEGGCFLTFQDPLRYDRLPMGHFAINRFGYFAWRVRQGDYRRGLRTRWRRLQRRYSAQEPADFEEYHVVRAGVDSDAITALLERRFDAVERVDYWSTQSAALQRIGERLSLRSSFGILALGKQGRE